jgi:hypothetical protein
MAATQSYHNFWVLASKLIWLIAREGFSTTLNLKALNITELPTLLGQDVSPFVPRENLQSPLTMRTSFSVLTIQQIQVEKEGVIRNMAGVT